MEYEDFVFAQAQYLRKDSKQINIKQETSKNGFVLSRTNKQIKKKQTNNQARNRQKRVCTKPHQLGDHRFHTTPILYNHPECKEPVKILSQKC